MPEEVKDKGILDRKVDEIETKKEKTDEELIQDAISQTDKFNNAQNISGEVFLTLPFLKAYKLRFDMGIETESAVAFTFPEINLGVLKFMVENAKKGNFVEFYVFTDNVVLAKDYKPVQID